MPGAVEDVLAKIAQAFQGITVEGGYSFDVKQVYRHSLNVDSLDSSDLPVVMVLRVPDSEVEWCDALLYRQILKVMVSSFVRPDGRNVEVAKAATLGEELLSNLKRVQMADPSFGSTYCRSSRIVLDSSDAGWDNEGAFVYIIVACHVYWGASTPP